MEISPKTAAALAKDIYLLQSALPSVVQDFLDRPEFLAKTGSSTQLKAEVGARLLSTKSGFGICVRGGKGYENDLFLIFRGTTISHYGADVITDLRIGVERSTTGLSVHIGFNHA